LRAAIFEATKVIDFGGGCVVGAVPVVVGRCKTSLAATCSCNNLYPCPSTS
jgi:hypothetical protein